MSGGVLLGSRIGDGDVFQEFGIERAVLSPDQVLKTEKTRKSRNCRRDRFGGEIRTEKGVLFIVDRIEKWKRNPVVVYLLVHLNDIRWNESGCEILEYSFVYHVSGDQLRALYRREVELFGDELFDGDI